ncbi:excinuclease ABC subunit UvrB [Desulfobacterales bacterium HSG17]|nr:excinuclease ABC subunit UvrB [Desulfobacterales bacterium HSG17]
MGIFKLVSDYKPQGDQPAAIKKLSQGILQNLPHQVLLGVTGSGKTFTMAHVIAELGRPALIFAPNKTLAGQLFNEFKNLFPENAVEYFVSYYDYFQPEAYIPSSDTYIQKDSAINDMIDKLRHSATRSVLCRRDVIVIASVSCIYGLGAPEEYLDMRVELETGTEYPRNKMLKDLVAIQYERNDMDFHRGVFRVRGDRVEIFPAYEEEKAIRVDYWGDEIESISEINPLTGSVLHAVPRTAIFPASHYVTKSQTLKRAIQTIKNELKNRTDYFHDVNKLIEAQRIEERTLFDLEMIREIGYCNGIENYSRHLTGREPGEPPPTLLDYFPEDFTLFIDESHIAVSQVRAMFKGDRSRKGTLVEYGFRLPSALDNRPLRFDEFTKRIRQTIFVSATPADYELDIIGDNPPVEQIVRPTGLIDPEIEIRPATHQVDDLLTELRMRIENGERVLITTLTKRMAEDLTDYYADLGIRIKYLHSEVKTLERMELIRELREGEYDVLVGINLLREGLDIPEVALVAIMDADKEGFLRSARSLIQIFGRAARNINGKVLLYADVKTASMTAAIDETNRRRVIQNEYNQKHNITPKSIQKEIGSIYDSIYEADYVEITKVQETEIHFNSSEDIRKTIDSLEKEMRTAARALSFEKAALLRDQIQGLKKLELFTG